MEITNDKLEKIAGGGAPQNFIFTCPYCKTGVEMTVSSETVVTCLNCRRIILDMNRVNRKKGGHKK